jgi:hypothetical protein
MSAVARSFVSRWMLVASICTVAPAAGWAAPVNPKAFLDRFDREKIVEETSVPLIDCQRDQRWSDAMADSTFKPAVMACYYNPVDQESKGLAETRLARVSATIATMSDVGKRYHAAAGLESKTPAVCRPPSDATSAQAREADSQAAAAFAKSKAEAARLARAGADAARDAHAKAAAPEKAALGQQLALADKQAQEAELAANEARLVAEEKAHLAAKALADVAPVKAEMAQASRDLRNAIDALLTVAHRSPDDFERRVKTEGWREACAEVARQVYGQSPAKGPIELAPEMAGERERAHAKDILRKASALATGLSNGNGLVERPGAPDKVIVSVMSALGAERSSNGTQAVMTLNLASTIWPNDEERLKQSPLVRNLFLRAQLPLDTAKGGETATGTTTSTTAEPSTASEVSRFSMILGGSFEDDSDQRLPSNDACNFAILAYLPLPESDKDNESLANERKPYYSICNGIAANRRRISWRAGLGFLTEPGMAAGTTPAATGQRTRTELFAGTAVYAPLSNMFFNLLYQHLFIPTPTNTLGVGMSLAGNVGGESSGVDAWARMGLDTLMLFTREHDDPWQWQWRVALTTQARLSDNTITTVSLGPRFLGGTSDPGFLASIALSYDADNLIQPLLTPIAPTPPAK